MNSQNLGALSSDQKIDKVFHAFGYSVPVGKDGRRLWPKKFKREMGRRMRSGKLSADKVRKTCRVSDSTVYEWKKSGHRAEMKQKHCSEMPAPAFAEVKVKVSKDETHSSGASGQIIFRRAGCEVQLPSGYPVERLIQLLSAFDTAS